MQEFGSSAVVYAMVLAAISRLRHVSALCGTCAAGAQLEDARCAGGADSRTPSALNAGLGEVNLDSKTASVLDGWSRRGQGQTGVVGTGHSRCDVA